MSTPETLPTDDAFAGTSRFRVRRQLGSGGMGVVYEVYDREREERVALKTLLNVKPRALRLLKQEFRALAEVRHPNLVRLHELFEQDGRWFFTMEMVEGTDWLSWVAGARAGAVEIDSSARTVTEAESFSRAPEAATPGVDLARLRSVLRQVIEGLDAVHRAGKLHCDIKPSNVLVTAEGRAVVLDFGLATSRDASQRDTLATRRAAGTPAAMSPEQTRGQALTPASDLYGVGVLLYRSLTGRTPFVGSSRQVIAAKNRLEPRPPIFYEPSIPADLNEICVSLLRRDPAKRPTAAAVLQRLGAPVETAPSRGARPSLIGREGPLDALYGALAASRVGRPVVAVVTGPSGIGKSELLRTFLDEVERTPEPLVLRARCYAQEAVSYKAFDAAVDGLARYLVTAPEEEVADLIPPGAVDLAQIFPVLQEVDAIRRLPLGGGPRPSLTERRWRAFRSLEEILRRLGRRRPVLMAIDDLQRADDDSLALLRAVFTAPAPPVALVVTVRTTPSSPSEKLDVLLRAFEHDPQLELRKIVLEPLSEEESEKVAEAFLSPTTSRDVVEAVARHGEGNPFLLEQLARYASSGRSLDAVTLAHVVEARLEGLGAEERRLLEVMALAERPMPRSVVAAAAGLEGQGLTAVEALLDAQLLRARGLGGGDEVDLRHDRLRRELSKRLDDEQRRACHLSIAKALEARGEPDDELLAHHYTLGGNAARGLEHAGRAAERAELELAFDRAARLWRLALETGALDAGARRAVRIRLGDALANAGRGVDAARAYLWAAERGGADVAELERRAASQLLRTGHVDEALEVLRRVLARVGVSLAGSPASALASVTARRAWLRLRGKRYVLRNTAPSRETKARLDALWTAALGLVQIDPVRAADFQARHLALALRAGEPHHLARAMAFEAGVVGATGYAGRSRCYQLIAEATLIAERYDSPVALGVALLADGVTSFLLGRWQLARRFCEQAEKLFRRRCVGVGWEITAARVYTLASLSLLGELEELGRRQPELYARAVERDDLFARLAFRIVAGVPLRLAEDQPEQARLDVDEALGRWSREGFHLEHWWGLVARAEIDLYRGRAFEAWSALWQAWPKILGASLRYLPLVRYRTSYLRAQAALAAALDGNLAPARERALLLDARNTARRLRAAEMPLARAMAVALDATLAMARGDDGAAANLLVQSERTAESLDMPIHAAAARHRRGLLLGGDRGAALKASAITALMDRGVRNPRRMLGLLSPGWDRASRFRA